MIKCADCGAENEADAAFCRSCARPMTAYSGQFTGETSAAARERLRGVTSRPQAVPLVAGGDLALALFGPLGRLAAMLQARPTVNSDLSNYPGAAFGAVGIALAAFILVPMAAALAFVAWATWTQRAWTWMANAVLLGGTALFALFGWWPAGGFGRLVVLAACGYAAWQWTRPGTRQWYGLD